MKSEGWQGESVGSVGRQGTAVTVGNPYNGTQMSSRAEGKVTAVIVVGFWYLTLYSR